MRDNGQQEQWDLLVEGVKQLREHEYAIADNVLAAAAMFGDKYAIEVLQLKARARYGLLDYVGAADCINQAWGLLCEAEDKGDKAFQYSLAIDRGYYNKNIGNMMLAAESYKSAYQLACNLEDAASSFGSYAYTILTRVESRQTANDIINQFSKSIALYRNVIQPCSGVKKKITAAKIRVAYLSPDFRQHVLFDFYYALLSKYDKQRFHIACFSLSKQQDKYTEKIKLLVDDWYYAANLSYECLAQMIKDAEVDILVDLAGHSAGSALPIFAYRCAPIQIFGLGWMESTGFVHTDYILTDKYCDGSDEIQGMFEAPLYLSSQFCYTAKADLPFSQGAPCMRKGYITFGVFNHYYKFTDETMLAWKKIMARVEKSRLLLKCQMYASASAVKMVRARMLKLGLDVNRIDFEPATANYMERYLDVDIALDTFPYTGGGTTLDALYMGVPVISKYGERRGSRFGLSILSNAGLGDLAVSDWSGYISRAVFLAEDVALLDDLHRNLRYVLENSNVMNSSKYIAEVEEIYTSLYKRYYNSTQDV